jgi:hypothetical protein
MSRFEVEVEGAGLGRAMAALNDAAIPTISAGSSYGGPTGSAGWFRRRFLRSPAFTILIVIILAFLVQRLISPADHDKTPSYDQFLAQVDHSPASIAKVTLDPDRNTVKVSERNGGSYEIGYPPSSEEYLVFSLRRQHVATVVEKSDGGSVLSWVVYFLPFALFFGFFIGYLRRTQRNGKTGSSEPTGLKAVVDADSAQDADALVRAALPPDGSYRVGRPREL